MNKKAGFSFTDFPGFVPERLIVKENLDRTGWMQIIGGGK